MTPAGLSSNPGCGTMVIQGEESPMTTFAAFAVLALVPAVPVVAARFGIGSMRLFVKETS